MHSNDKEGLRWECKTQVHQTSTDSVSTRKIWDTRRSCIESTCQTKTILTQMDNKDGILSPVIATKYKSETPKLMHVKRFSRPKAYKQTKKIR